jgi:hypothetical protein
MASEDLNMSKPGTAGEGKHVTLTVPQKLEIIRRLESDESQREGMALYSIGSSTMFDLKK